MNKIERMLQELCPEGVEYKKLIDVAEILYGYPFDANLFTEDNQYIPLIRIRDVKSAKASTYYKGDFNDIYIIKRGDILVGMDGNFNLEKWNDRNGVLNQRVCKIYAKNQLVVINEYLYHLLGPIFKKIEEEVKGGTVKHLSAAKINRIEIPVPPLPIQKEIVRILDHFTELTAELQARQEQYEYYRNKLLTFTKIGGSTQSVTWMKMSEIAEISSGKNRNKNDIGTYPVYGSTGIIAYSENFIYATPQILIARVGANAGFVHIAIGKYDVSDNTLILSIKDRNKYYFKYIYYLLSNIQLNKLAKGGGQPLVTATDIKKLLVPIPSPDKQQHIVEILDKFETLVNDLTQGLPAEIAAVQEQYEYYLNSAAF